MKPVIYVLLILVQPCLWQTTAAQVDSTLLRSTARDTLSQPLNMEAVYNRPLSGIGKSPISLGGYLEANWQHLGTDGVSEGHQFQFRRITIFLASRVAERIHVLTELEFEEGGREISVELAVVDITVARFLTLRGGMIVNPIGAFNQNHDGPKWEFVDRPISSTQMLPATWSNAGAGVYGKQYAGSWVVGYEFYLSGGFDNSIIQNPQNKTFLPAAKENPDRFESSASGTPLVTAKVAAGNDAVGEVGLSYMGGIYNTFQEDGLTVDEKRRCDVIALDYTSRIPGVNTRIVGEWAWVFVDVPPTYSQQFGTKQRGGFLDIVQPVVQGEVFGWANAEVNVACRFEYVDWNVGQFRETGGNIAEDLWSIVPAVSFRPTPQTVLRLNYRYMRQRDILGNPPATTGGFSIGIATYF
jgi:hypothetical protein